MIDHRTILQHLAAEILYRDQARPIEWLSLLALAGWLQFLLAEPERFQQPRYEAFSALPPAAWALIIAGVILAQLAALWPGPRAATIRFVAMALATGMWTVIALSFWSSAETTAISARTNTVIAFASFVTAVHLGLMRRRD